ncbi:MAG: arginine deiminase-related protein [Bacteroidetes bacterium]|nr:arginine deiminase-related protein [Bacteroidota bacterium]
MQNTSNLLMIKPVNFGFNQETAVNNAFQVAGHSDIAQKNAAKEFDNFAKKLEFYGIDLTVVEDTPNPYTPDSIFPNNWISFHKDNKICLYPMFAENRRKERKPNVINVIKQKFKIDETIDFTHFEKDNIFLEGTGSMVLDRENDIAYACLSPRTNEEAFNKFCAVMNFKGVSFVSLDDNNKEIYHTNVMMCVADKYAVICLDTIKNAQHRQIVTNTLANSGKEIIEISTKQMNNFAGNMLQVKNKEGTQFLVMSTTAFRSLTQEQVSRIKNYNDIIYSELDTIEKNGGGSARCMLAEIFLDRCN